MTKPPVTPLTLADDEIDIVRLVARCLTNQEIASLLGIRVEKFRVQLDKIHARIGTNSTSGSADSVMSRVRMVAWAYEHGLMTEDPTEVAQCPQPAFKPSTGPNKVSGPLVDAVVDACEAIYLDRPRGHLRKLATEVLQDAGRLPRPGQRRAMPVTA